MMMFNPNPSQPTQPVQNFVEKMANSRSQGDGVDATKKVSKSLDSVSKIMANTQTLQKQSVDVLKSIDTNIKAILKQDQAQAKEAKKNLSGVGSVMGANADKFRKKEDPTAGMKKNIEDIEEIIRDDVKWRKDEAKKKGGLGILGALAGLLTVGGLLGYLITGKQEFLFSVVKGLKHAGKLLMDFVTLPLKALKSVGDITKATKKVSSVFKFAQNMAKSITKFNNVGAAITGGKKALSGMVSFSKMFGKGVSSIAKTSKSVLDGTKSIKSMFSGFKSIGNVVKSFGGLMKGGLMTGIKALGKGAGKAGSKVALKKIPVIGSILAIFFAIERFKKGDVVGALLELGSGVASIFPGVGTAISLAIDGLLLMNDFSKGGIVGGIKNMFGGMFGGKKDKDKNGTETPTGDGYSIGGTKFAPQEIEAPTSLKWGDLTTGLDNFTTNAVGYAKQSGGAIKGATKYAVKTAGDALGYMLSGGANINGIKPKMWANFLGMASDYRRMYGKNIPVGSAYRSIEEQERLYRAGIVKYGKDVGKWVAPPGKSMHNFGFAMDIGDRGGQLARELKGSPEGNLLSKWKLELPMDHEPWHIEPEGFKAKYADVRSGTVADSDVPVPSGDAYTIGGGFKPMSTSVPVGDKSSPFVVIIAEESVKALSVAIAQESRANMPTQQKSTTGGTPPVNIRK